MNQEKKPFNFELFDYITVKSETQKRVISRDEKDIRVDDICIEWETENGHTDIFVTADDTPVEWLKIRWNTPLPKQVKVLGDAWERGYGDLEWRALSGRRSMPWYFLASLGTHQWGFGVRVRPSAMCYWQADTKGISLVLDVRSGGEGVILKGRRLKAAQLVCMEEENADSFSFARDFCRMMCPDPIFPKTPVYGSNNWYYAYGDSSQEEILKDTEYVLKVTEGAPWAPYMVIDDGWEEHHRLNEYCGGPWRGGNDKFPDMKGLAETLKEKGVHPGIWIRFLLNEDPSIPSDWRLPENGCLDPSHPQALDYIRQDVRRLCEWGYELIKHDFSTYDLFGRWGFEMNPMVTAGKWHFYNQGLTSAEVVKLLYQTVYDVTREYGTLIIGCNTIGHLGAGRMEISRAGDDTSGLHWERSRRMGVNTLAFRLPQHKTFYDVDADCVGITGDIPWELNRQWADVIAKSGTPLFVSAKPGVLKEDEFAQLQTIMIEASAQTGKLVPADWQETDCPEVWTDGETQITYNWYEEAGLELESKEEKYYADIPLS